LQRESLSQASGDNVETGMRFYKALDTIFKKVLEKTLFEMVDYFRQEPLPLVVIKRKFIPGSFVRDKKDKRKQVWQDDKLPSIKDCVWLSNHEKSLLQGLIGHSFNAVVQEALRVLATMEKEKAHDAIDGIIASLNTFRNHHFNLVKMINTGAGRRAAYMKAAEAITIDKKTKQIDYRAVSTFINAYAADPKSVGEASAQEFLALGKARKLLSVRMISNILDWPADNDPLCTVLNMHVRDGVAFSSAASLDKAVNALREIRTTIQNADDGDEEASDGPDVASGCEEKQETEGGVPPTESN